jgi:hypothetical protein
MLLQMGQIPELLLPESWRRRLRLSVRGLMVIVLVLGGGMGWVAYRARVQREAVATIKRAGGEIAYSWQWANGVPVQTGARPPWPDWLSRLLGPDFLDTVTYVRLYGEQFDDVSLRAACRLPCLEELIVVNTSVTDAGAEDLRQLTNLRSLDLRLNRITNRPLRHIGEMSKLRKLWLAMRLSPVPLRDEDMAFLARLTKLEDLMLPGACLTDDWLVYITNLKNLRSVQLYDMALTANGVNHLKGLPANLTANLTLHGTTIPLRRPNDRDAGIAEAKQHPLIRLKRRK